MSLEQDDEQAFKLSQKAAQLGHLEAMNMLGGLYFDGKGVERNEQKSLEWFEKAAACGHLKAMINCARAYLNGSIHIQDYQKTHSYLDQAIRYNNLEALIFKAELYLLNNEPEQHFKLISEAMETNKFTSQPKHKALLLLGYSYKNGQGCQQNLPLAMYNFEKAYLLGEAHAYDHLQDIMHSLAQQTESDRSSAAQQLMRLVWQDLVKGQKFTDYTMSLLKKHCPNQMLDKLTGTDSPYSNDLMLLDKVSRADHPIVKSILGPNSTGHKRLIRQLDNVQATYFCLMNEAKQSNSYLSWFTTSFLCKCITLFLGEQDNNQFHSYNDKLCQITRQQIIWYLQDNSCPNTLNQLVEFNKQLRSIRTYQPLNETMWQHIKPNIDNALLQDDNMQVSWLHRRQGNNLMQQAKNICLTLSPNSSEIDSIRANISQSSGYHAYCSQLLYNSAGFSSRVDEQYNNEPSLTFDRN